jgi:hypothetical protein
LGANPGVKAGDSQETADHEAGENEQEHGKSNLTDDETGTDTGASVRRSCVDAAGLEIGAEVFFDGEKGRRKAEEQSRQKRKRDRKEKHGEIERHICFAGDADPWNQTHDSQTQISKKTSDEATCETEQETLQEKLADQTGASSAERNTKSNLTSASAVVREKEASDIARGNQKQENDGGNEEE